MKPINNMSALELIEYLTKSPLNFSDPKHAKHIKKRTEQLAIDVYRLQRLIVALEDAQ